ncbi:VIT1/CCC1 transporter family protein [Gordonia humi]|uniref:VIT1/CCC1 family predicted Fe2+/Mn2+ transporter n=1 Tax=Gordonia humi TaxID=686429 RepID=A0A840F1X4_9ACTN|nr:VIT family protein [Gordonia humi]MBB4134330.1 VIT1/CCC1 family predicted Fe2+/Mn2+ transporter [Gordonia humi]
MSTDVDATHADEPHTSGLANRLNWLRAGMLGANDGIVSTAGIVVGVAAATTERGSIFTAGIAGLAAGAVSMALGEYVSVSTQRDTEASLLAKEKWELENDPDDELDELAMILTAKGINEETARDAARELTAHDAFTAHAQLELGIDPNDLTNPWQAAGSSAVSFTVGALLPLIAILLPPETWRVPVCFAVVLVALAFTGALGAKLGGSRIPRATIRMVIGGALAMAVTYGIGAAFGQVVG